MKNIFERILLFLAVGFGAQYCYCRESGPLLPENINQNFIMHKIISQTEKDMQRVLKFEGGSEGGGISGGVQHISLYGNIYGIYSEDELRRLFVECELIFRNNINSIRALRPVLCRYPFPVERINLSFFLKDPQTKGRLPLNTLNSIGMTGGKVQYCKNAPEDFMKTYKEETFAEALSIVEQERKEKGLPSLVVPPTQLKEMKLPPSMPHAKPSNLYEEREFDKFLYESVDKISSKYGIKLICEGNFSGGFKAVYYGLILYSFEAKALEESKTITKNFFKDYYSFLQNSLEVKEFQKWTSRYSSVPTPENPISYKPVPDVFPLEEIALKITFWDKEFNPQMPPNIAQVTFSKNVFSFYQADPVTHELSLVYEAPYEVFMKEDVK